MKKQQGAGYQLVLPEFEAACHAPTGKGGTPNSGAAVERQVSMAPIEDRSADLSLMKQIASPANLRLACKKVKSNKGSAGIDGMTVDELAKWLPDHLTTLQAQLLTEKYLPTPVRGVQIPKPGGGERQLGIPTVKDRLVQQAIFQILGPMFDRTFSRSSYGFRPKRSAHDALKAGAAFVKDGYTIVVDLDLEKFFDRVNHDILRRLSRNQKRNDCIRHVIYIQTPFREVAQNDITSRTLCKADSWGIFMLRPHSYHRYNPRLVS